MEAHNSIFTSSDNSYSDLSSGFTNIGAGQMIDDKSVGTDPDSQ